MKRLVLALLLLASPAFAELTTAEKAEVKKLHLAAVESEQAVRALRPAIQAATTKEATADVRSTIAYGQTKLRIAISLYVGADPMFEQSNQYSQLDRAGWLIEARAHLDSARTAFSVAAALPATPGDVAQRLQLAVILLDSFNRTLAYTDPKSRAYPFIVGPHGEWDAAMGHLALAGSNLGQAADALVAAYRGGADTVVVGNVDTSLMEIESVNRIGMLNFAAIALTDTQCQRNFFRLVADVLGLLTNNKSVNPGGAPYFLRVINDASLSIPALTSFNVFLSRAWSAQNGATWRAFVFPDDATLLAIRAAGPGPSDPSAPPLCGT